MGFIKRYSYIRAIFVGFPFGIGCLIVGINGFKNFPRSTEDLNFINCNIISWSISEKYYETLESKRPIMNIINDSMYVSFSDTISIMMCDCMCDFSVIINAGKTNSTDIKINYNGNWNTILPKDYMPLVKVGKRWNTLRLIPGLENTLPTHIEYSIESEQLHAFCWNGKKYYEIKGRYITNGDYINPSDTVSNYVREENGKVFLLDPSQIYADGCEEALLYDFNAKVGDTLTLGFDSINFVAVPIETSMIQGRRIIALADLTEPIGVTILNLEGLNPMILLG